MGFWNRQKETSKNLQKESVWWGDVKAFMMDLFCGGTIASSVSFSDKIATGKVALSEETHRQSWKVGSQSNNTQDILLRDMKAKWEEDIKPKSPRKYNTVESLDKYIAQQKMALANLENSFNENRPKLDKTVQTNMETLIKDITKDLKSLRKDIREFKKDFGAIEPNKASKNLLFFTHEVHEKSTAVATANLNPALLKKTPEKKPDENPAPPPRSKGPR